jgi:hypothetical protein
MPVSQKSRKREESADLRLIGDFTRRLYATGGAYSTPGVLPRPRPRSRRAATRYPSANVQSRRPSDLLPLASEETSQQASAANPTANYLVEYQVIARIPKLEVAAGVYDDDGWLLNLNGDVE